MQPYQQGEKVYPRIRQQECIERCSKVSKWADNITVYFKSFIRKASVVESSNNDSPVATDFAQYAG